MSLGQTRKILQSKRAFAAFIVVLIASAIVFTITASILLSIQSAGSTMLGESQNVTVVSQSDSRTPLTGALPLGLADSLASIKGIEVSPEVLAPSLLEGQPVMVRGVDPSRFIELEGSDILLNGSPITANDTSFAMVGKDLASKMGIAPGSQIMLFGAISTSLVTLTVKSMFSTGSSMDSEIVAPLWVGQWLRGFDYSTISVVRVRIDSSQNLAHVQEEIQSIIGSPQHGGSQGSTFLTPIETFLPITPVSAIPNNIHLQVSPSTSGQFLSRSLGLSQGTVWVFSILVFVCMALGVIYSFQEVVIRSRVELGILRSIGMSAKHLRRNLLSLSMIAAVASSVVGWVIALIVLNVVPGLDSISIAFYSMNPTSMVAIGLGVALIISVVEVIVASVYSSMEFSSRLGSYEMTLSYTEPESLRK